MDDNAKSFRGKVIVPTLDNDINEKITYRILGDVKNLPEENVIKILKACCERLSVKTIRESIPTIIEEAVQSKKIGISDLENDVSKLNEDSQPKYAKKIVYQTEEPEIKQVAASLEPKNNNIAPNVEVAEKPKKRSFLDIADEYLKN